MKKANNNKTITLTIRGARAQRGVSLSDFEAFIDNFLAALRDYDRADRGEPTRKSGHPDRRAEAVTAFRLRWIPDRKRGRNHRAGAHGC